MQDGAVKFVFSIFEMQSSECHFLLISTSNVSPYIHGHLYMDPLTQFCIHALYGHEDNQLILADITGKLCRYSITLHYKHPCPERSELDNSCHRSRAAISVLFDRKSFGFQKAPGPVERSLPTLSRQLMATQPPWSVPPRPAKNKKK